MSGRFETEDNPLSRERVLELVKERVEQWSPHSVSITGGEPLLQSEFLAELLPEIPAPVYLDTSGTMAGRLETIIDHLDFVAPDIKLPSCPGVKVQPEDAKRCVEIARRKDVFVKVVVMEDSREIEVENAAHMVAEVDPSIPFILQIATEVNEQTVAPGGREIRKFRKAAERHLRDVSVLPQLHPLMGWK